MALPLILSNLSATLKSIFNIDKFCIDASALTTSKTITVADASITSPIDIIVPDEAYDATAWNGNLEVPTKNAIRDKIESVLLKKLLIMQHEGFNEDVPYIAGTNQIPSFVLHDNGTLMYVELD